MAIAGMDLLVDPPPVFNHQGDCCQPTPQCHAYFKRVIDVLNSEAQWDNEAQQEEAMAHINCCIRQFRASCADPPMGAEILWRDPAVSCSNKQAEVPEGLDMSGVGDDDEVLDEGVDGEGRSVRG